MTLGMASLGKWCLLSTRCMHSKAGSINGYTSNFQTLFVGKLGFIVLRSCSDCYFQKEILDQCYATLGYLTYYLIREDEPRLPILLAHPQDYEGDYTAIIGHIASLPES